MGLDKIKRAAAFAGQKSLDGAVAVKDWYKMRYSEPGVESRLKAERVRLKESWAKSGTKTKEAATSILFNGLFMSTHTLAALANINNKHGKKHKGDPHVKQAIRHGVEMGADFSKMVARIFLSTGRTGFTGMRHAATL